MSTSESPPGGVTRRTLLKGTAAGIGLAAGAGVATAAPAGWMLNANGYVSPLTFSKRLNLTTPNGAWQVLGGLAANAFGNPVLAYGYLLGGLNFVRVCDIDMTEVQIYRTTHGDGQGTSGQLFRYRFDGAKYQRTGPYPFTLSWGAEQPWQLPVDTQPRNTNGIEAWKTKYYDGSSTFAGEIKDMHYYEEPNALYRNVWGRIFEQSTVGYTLQKLFLAGEYDVGVQATEKRHEGPFGFVRPLDTSFTNFQIFRGTERRADQYYAGSYSGAERLRRGTIFAIDTTQNTQRKFKWCTHDYYTTAGNHVYDNGQHALSSWIYS
jgi:hypothetical protein